MRTLLERVVGIILVIVSVIGLTLNVGALVFLPQIETEIKTQVSQSLAVFESTLGTTEQGMVVVSASLENAGTTLDAVEITTRSVATTISDTTPVLDTVTDLTSETLPVAVENTQAALGIAAVSATAIDIIIATIASIPFAGDPTQVPAISLSESLGGVQDTLDPLATSFDEVTASLVVAKGNLDIVNRDIVAVADSLSEFDTTLTQAQDVTTQYRSVISQQRAVVQSLQINAIDAITWGIRGIIALLVWLLVAQIGLLSQGLEMIGRANRRGREVIAE